MNAAFPFKLGGYRCQVIDSPWMFNDPGGRISPDYPCMTDNELRALPMQHIAPASGHIYSWTTDSHLELALELLPLWGWEYKRCIIWVKVTRSPEELKKIAADGAAALIAGDVRSALRALKKLAAVIGKLFQGGGHYVRSAHEICLFGVRGGLVPPTEDRLPSVLMAPPVLGPNGRPIHSRKPDELLVRAERVSPGPRIELFARRRRPGWDCWGNEAPEETHATT